MANVAMFPLGSVLFPHTPLALRIFEERYLVMLGRLLDDEDPQFGVVLIERGSEAGGGDQRFGIGTMARITNVMAGERDIHLIAVGGARVEVSEWSDDEPYPTAAVRELPALVWDDALTPLRNEAERIVRRVLSRAAEYSDVQWDPNIEISDDPLESSWPRSLRWGSWISSGCCVRPPSAGCCANSSTSLWPPSPCSPQPSMTPRSTRRWSPCSKKTRTPTPTTMIRMPLPTSGPPPAEAYQPRVPGSPLKGPTMSEVTQPP